MADISLTTGSPTSTETGLTEGGNYSILHKGGVKVEAEVDTDDWQAVHQARTGGFTFLAALPGTKLRFTIDSGSSATKVRLTAQA